MLNSSSLSRVRTLAGGAGSGDVNFRVSYVDFLAFCLNTSVSEKFGSFSGSGYSWRENSRSFSFRHQAWSSPSALPLPIKSRRTKRTASFERWRAARRREPGLKRQRTALTRLTFASAAVCTPRELIVGRKEPSLPRRTEFPLRAAVMTSVSSSLRTARQSVSVTVHRELMFLAIVSRVRGTVGQPGCRTASGQCPASSWTSQCRES